VPYEFVFCELRNLVQGRSQFPEEASIRLQSLNGELMALQEFPDGVIKLRGSPVGIPKIGQHVPGGICIESLEKLQ